MKNKKLFAKYPLIGYYKNSDRVIFDKVYKEMRWVPKHIAEKLVAWAKEVALKGIREVRKVPGYHDEPLHGDRQGQRSIRLSRSYRAIYVEIANGHVAILIIEEITKHEY